MSEQEYSGTESQATLPNATEASGLAETARMKFGDALSGSVLREAAAIVVISAILAFVVNTWYHPSPLSYVYESRKVATAGDELFNSLVNSEGNASTSTAAATSTSTSTTTSSSTLPSTTAAGKAVLPVADAGNAQSASAAHTMQAQPATSAGDVTKKTPASTASAASDKTKHADQSSASASAAQEPLKLPIAISYEQVMKLLARPGTATFIDARKKEEHEKGAFANSLNVDVLQFQANPQYRDECMRLLYSLPKDKILVAYCGGGNCELSHELCDIMIPMGFTKVFIYLGGWNEYKEKQGMK
jgi:rhodanese-related sulfurtransferase